MEQIRDRETERERVICLKETQRDAVKQQARGEQLKVCMGEREREREKMAELMGCRGTGRCEYFKNPLCLRH